MRLKQPEAGRPRPLARRALLAAVGCGVIARQGWAMGSAALGVSGLPVPPSHRLGFQVMRHGSAIGTHTLAFQASDTDLRVDIAVNVLVHLGPIPLVHYTHRAMETWKDGHLSVLEGQTNKNGMLMHMRAYHVAEGLRVEGSGTDPYIAPPDALPTTYWNPRMLWVPMIGTQDGGLVRPRVREKTIEEVRLASGGALPAQLYSLSGDLQLDLWYHQSDWVGMRFEVADGSVITYQRL
jgi:hypothetical protein